VRPGAADPEPRVWRSRITVQADPHHVLDTLTEVDACQTWSPVGFELDAPDLPRLRAGTKVGVSSGVAGRRVRFCVEVFRADPDRLLLRAAGPVEFVADYEVRPAAHGSQVDAAISVHRRSGRLAGLVAGVTSTVLSAGALHRTLARIGREAERRQQSSEFEKRGAA
jgi:Polyketide cyclase / dehydrase and lipid transport